MDYYAETLRYVGWPHARSIVTTHHVRPSDVSPRSPRNVTFVSSNVSLLCATLPSPVPRPAQIHLPIGLGTASLLENRIVSREPLFNSTQR